VAKKRNSAKKPADTQKQAEKRARREERRAAEAKAKQTATRNRRVKAALATVIGVAVVGALGFVVFRKVVPPELPGVAKPASEGRPHLESGQTIAYATATPTSGSHSPGSARCGIYNQQLPLEAAVHALEHGTVVIWYQPELSDDVAPALREIVNRHDDHVILSPNGQLTDPIVVTAWNRLKAYQDVDPEIEDFITTYRLRAPEDVACDY